eukprot:755411-Hanusia_phi.AAC.4
MRVVQVRRSLSSRVLTSSQRDGYNDEGPDPLADRVLPKMPSLGGTGRLVQEILVSPGTIGKPPTEEEILKERLERQGKLFVPTVKTKWIGCEGIKYKAKPLKDKNAIEKKLEMEKKTKKKKKKKRDPVWHSMTMSSLVNTRTSETTSLQARSWKTRRKANKIGDATVISDQ